MKWFRDVRYMYMKRKYNCTGNMCTKLFLSLNYVDIIWQTSLLVVLTNSCISKKEKRQLPWKLGDFFAATSLVVSCTPSILDENARKTGACPWLNSNTAVQLLPKPAQMTMEWRSRMSVRLKDGAFGRFNLLVYLLLRLRRFAIRTRSLQLQQL